MARANRNEQTKEPGPVPPIDAHIYTVKLEVLREHRPPPNASIIDCDSSSRIRIVVRNGLPDPDSDADSHQNVTSWSLGHTQALHKTSSKSVGNVFDNPVNADFGLRTPGSGR